MPQKSHVRANISRPARSIVQDVNNEQLPQYIYRHLQDVKVHINKLKRLKEWNIEITSDSIILMKNIPQFRVIIDDGLGYTVKVLIGLFLKIMIFI